MFFSPQDLDRKSREPLYLQVFHILHKAIQKATPDFGTVLPSTAVLAEQFKVSQNTIRAAMRMLVDARLVCRIRHRGTVPVSCMRPEDPQRDNHSIGLVFPIEGHYAWQPILKLMRDAAGAEGYSLEIFLYSWNQPADEKSALEQAFRTCSGVILYGNSQSADRELVKLFNLDRPPLVLFFLYFDDLDASIVASDGYSAAAELTELLIRKGCRRPLFCYDYMNNTIRLRIAGFKDALLRCGMDFRPEMTRYVRSTDFRQQARQFAPDSLICCGPLPQGVAKKIPPDRIVLFHSAHLKSGKNNGNIWVNSPTDLLAREAIDEVLRRIRDPETYRRKILIRMKIEERGKKDE